MFIGYAIIQLPDFVLILYQRLKNIMRFQNVQNTNTTEIDVAPVKSLISSAPHQAQTEEQEDSVNNRVSRLEEDNVNIYRKLDEILVTMDKMHVTIAKLNEVWISQIK